MAYQPPDLGGLVGNLAMSPGGFTSPTATTPVTDLSQHYSGQKGSSNTMRSADSDTRQTLMLAAGIVLGALALLWIMRLGIFRSIHA